MRRLALVLLQVFIIAGLNGCAPSIDSVSFASAKDGAPPRHEEPIQVSADVTVKKGGAGTPWVELRPVAPPDEAFTKAGPLGTKEFNQEISGYSQYRFTGEIPGVNYGAYDLKVSVPFTEWLQRNTTSTTKILTVDAPKSCFSFDGDKQGFTLGQIKRSHETGEPWPYSPFSYLSPRNWPLDANGKYSLSFDVDPKFPGPPDETNYWTIDFISPDLTQSDEWQQSQGITFRAKSQRMSVWAQPVFRIKDEVDKWYAPKDTTTGKFMVFPIERDWQVMEWKATPALPKGVRKEFHIRIYGEPATGADKAGVHLDGICPIPPGLSPAGGKIVELIPNPLQ